MSRPEFHAREQGTEEWTLIQGWSWWGPLDAAKAHAESMSGEGRAGRADYGIEVRAPGGEVTLWACYVEWAWVPRVYTRRVGRASGGP